MCIKVHMKVKDQPLELCQPLGLSSECRAPPASALLAGVISKCYTITYVGLMHASKQLTAIFPLPLEKNNFFNFSHIHTLLTPI